ncbi:phosphotransferase [Allonocardiopsis opalescens]|uniref:Homoserine kinase n=1 Tax=Allonocardiopsis opalescens TaxID=1144618 RepID=A0A2T0PV93_9ACTN|nr:phosphotransferase [Allonocardiopsis opalescens]PRX95449.1 homoserine kinase [Allonocardiopsis opalescens]
MAEHAAARGGRAGERGHPAPGALRPAAALAPWGLVPERAQRVPGGELKETWLVDCAEGRFALQAYPPGSGTEVAVMAGWQRRLAEELPFVPPPRPTRAGALSAAAGGRPVTLVPHVGGAPADVRRPAEVAAAARALAAVHARTAAWTGAAPRPPYARFADLDWWRNPLWDLAEVEGLCRAAGRSGLWLRLRAGVGAAVLELSAFAALDLVEQVVHNDFHPGNVLVDGGRVAGVLDWAEATVQWRVLEVADAAWAFGGRAPDGSLDASAARAFLDAYTGAGGRITGVEAGLLVRALRLRRLWESCYQLGLACREAEPPAPERLSAVERLLTALDAVPDDALR